MYIKEAVPKIILNSRKSETIELTLHTYEGTFKCSAPSGKSTGKSEVPAFHSKGIKMSFAMLNKLCKFIEGKNFLMREIEDLLQVDVLIDALNKKYGYIGGNTVYSIHGALLRAAAADNRKELWKFIHDDVNPGKPVKIPMPIGNIIGGGLHSKEINGKRPDFQEFLSIPNEKNMSRAMTKNVHAYHYAQGLLKSRYINDEHATRTDKTNEEILDIMHHVSEKFGIRIGLDIASSSFYKKGYYEYKNKELRRDRVDQVDYIKRLIKKFNIFYVEDPMDEDDFIGFREILAKSKGSLIVGDDLTTTNPKRLRRAIRAKAINAIIIKPNQIGSLVEVKKVVELCKENKIKMIFSHRSGETHDNILGDYAVGFGADFMKSGAMGTERLVKIKRVIDIEKSL